MEVSLHSKDLSMQKLLYFEERTLQHSGDGLKQLSLQQLTKQIEEGRVGGGKRRIIRKHAMLA